MFHSPSIHADTIQAPQLSPFRQHRACPACGARGTLLHRLLQHFHPTQDSHMRHAYCGGGKEPTEERAVATSVGVLNIENRYLCAGILEPHLHVTCSNCGYQLLTRVARVEHVHA